MRKPWTSRPSVIDAVLSLFDLSTKVLETSLGSSIRATDREPGSQLPTLAAILFESIKERLDELSKLLFIYGHTSFYFTDHCYFSVQEWMFNMTWKNYNNDLIFCALKSLRH
jgi:hypothetical protein